MRLMILISFQEKINVKDFGDPNKEDGQRTDRQSVVQRGSATNKATYAINDLIKFSGRVIVITEKGFSSFN